MKAMTAGRDWRAFTSRTARYLLDRAVLYFKGTMTFRINQEVASAPPVSTVKAEFATEAARGIDNTQDFYNSQFIVLYGVQPSWSTERIREGLRDLKLSFGPFSKLIVCSESYVDELVINCADFNYDAYLMTCDGRNELKNAVRMLQDGKLYLSKSVITSYCVARRKEWV